jgi:hypothetical protein
LERTFRFEVKVHHSTIFILFPPYPLQKVIAMAKKKKGEMMKK